MLTKSKDRTRTVPIGVDPLDLYHRIMGIATENAHLTGNPDVVNAIRGLLRRRDYEGAIGRADDLVSTVYETSDQHYRSHQIASLIRKYPFPPRLVPGLDPRGTALKKFLASEHRCKWINRRFIASRRRTMAYSSILSESRKWIARVIGQKPDLASIYAQCDFGAGASVGTHGNATNIGRKLLTDKWTCTPAALPYVIPALWENFQIRELLLKRGNFYSHDPDLFWDLVSKRVQDHMVSYNMIGFVPKTAKTDRSIAIEPLLNGFLQKGIDLELRRFLVRVGIDLSNQEPNQLMAREGSLGGFDPYATLDLSAASDSISIELCRELLPSDWFVFLNRVRSPSYLFDDRIVRYEKFTSMGNGFCFPLETLLFASLCFGVYSVLGQRPDFRVYGDDIIVRRNTALLLSEVLSWCGFRLNLDKTFMFGPFRESCGADWYEGQDVRPVYLDEPLSELPKVFSFHNSSLRSERCYTFFESIRPLLRSSVKEDYRFVRMESKSVFRRIAVSWRFGPLDLPPTMPMDTCFIVPQDIFLSSRHVRWSRKEQRWERKELLSVPVRDPLRHPLQNAVEYLAVLRGSTSKVPLALRHTTKTRVRWI